MEVHKNGPQTHEVLQTWILFMEAFEAENLHQAAIINRTVENLCCEQRWQGSTNCFDQSTRVVSDENAYV